MKPSVLGPPGPEPPRRLGTGHPAPAKPEAVKPRPDVRKTVTILFADIVDSSRLSLALDPEALRNLLARYFGELSAVVQRHGGIVEKYIGDAIMAVFGVPILHEDDALRAVRAAVEMRDTLAILNHELEAGWGVRLANRIGVNTGEVIAGDHTQGHLSVTGEAVNVAKRLEEAATANEILIGEPTHRLVRDAVVVEPSGPRALKHGETIHALVVVERPRPRPRPCAPLRLALRRARTPACRARDRLPQRGPRQDLPPGDRARRRGCGKVAARAGVHERPCRRCHGPARPLPALRRGHHLLAAGRDRPGDHARGGTGPRRAAPQRRSRRGSPATRRPS